MTRRFPISTLVVLGLIAAACTGGGDDGSRPAAEPTSTPPTTAAPATTPPVTTASPGAATTTTAVPVASTTVPPGLQPQVLASALRPGLLATYEGTLETGLRWSNSRGRGLPLAGDGSSNSEWVGRRRLLTVAAGDLMEVVEDFVAESGSIVTDEDGVEMVTEMARDDLLDFKPATPPVPLGDDGFIPDPSVSGAPFLLAAGIDPLAAAAVVGPPLASGPVDVGDSWTVAYVDTRLGAIDIRAEIVDELVADDGSDLFLITFEGAAADPPDELSLESAAALAHNVGEERTLRDLLPFRATGSVTVVSAVVEGSMQFDPARGVAVGFESTHALEMSLTVESGGEPATLDVAAHAVRSLTLTEAGSASPFDIERVLDRFEADPGSLAQAALDDLAGHDLRDASDDQVDVVFDPLADVRRDLFAGAAIAVASAAGEEPTIVVSITNGGDLRGAPFVAEQLAEFVSGSRPDDVSIGDRAAFRVTIAGDEWLLYNNETHLFVTIGPRDAARRILGDLAEAADPYLWQPGDCLDFRDDFDNASPYAPYGIHGLRHCSVEHTHEVIYSEVLPEGPNARFPADLEERSDATCGRAFYEFTGTTELESALSLTRYRPDRDEWRKGSRYFACMVSIGRPGNLLELQGRIDGRDPELAFELEVGTCLLDLQPVRCDDLHDGEIIALFDLPHDPDAPRPDETAVGEEMAEQCEGALAEFEPGEGPGTVQVFDITDVFTAWEIGARRYYCMAAVFDDDGFRLDITGSLAAGWQEAEERLTT